MRSTLAGLVFCAVSTLVHLAIAQGAAPPSSTAAFPVESAPSSGAGAAPPAESPSPAPAPVPAPPTDAPAAPASAAPPPYPAGAGPTEDAVDVAPEPESKAKTEIGVDMTFYTGSPNSTELTSVAPIIRAIIPVGPFTLEPELPFAYYHYNVSVNVPGVITTSASDSGFLVGDPTFTFKYHARKKEVDVYVGAGVGLPLARVDQGDGGKAVGYALALSTRGAWNIWWYEPNALTFFAPAGVRYTAQSGFDAGAEVGAGVLINTGSGDRDVLGALQVGGHVGYAASFLEAGVRLKGVRLPGDGNSDSFQASLEPYVRGLFEHAFVGAGFLINLDEPLGPLLDTGSIWGLRIEGGARF